ncbi:MAG: ferritin family protein [Deltaproteobacteria bacterium]|nr:ferritin family protein [Deltaproteobacteria bacterium]
MNEQQIEAVVNGLQKAMRSEFEGYHFYMLAAQNTKDEKGQDAFRRLAKDEFDHMNYLQAQADHIVKNHSPDERLTLKQIQPFDGPNPIFSDDIKSRIKEANYEMTVLSVGVQLELNAMQTYREMASKTYDKVVSGFYLDLANFENSHYRMLVAQQDALKEAYWTANHFQPF